MKDVTKIAKTKKNEDGIIDEVMLENGNVVPINHAIIMAKHGLIEDTTVVRGKNGGEFLKSDTDSENSEKIGDLPHFKD